MKARYFLATLVLAFGIGQHACAQEQKLPESQQESQLQQTPAMQKSTEETGAGSEKSAVPDAGVAPASHAAKDETASTPPMQHADHASAKAEQDADWLQSFLYEVKITDVLVALFAGLLVLLAGTQARRMRDTARAATESASVAEKSATVAEKSARIAEDALIAGQRAFMFIREIQTILHQDQGSGKYHWTIHPIWANSGNTPTRSLAINTTYRLLDEPLPENYDFTQAGEELVPSIAGPRSMVEATPGTISSEDLQAVQDGKKFFYIWGWAEYHDIFEGTRKRVTRFCNQLVRVDGDAAAPASEHNPIQMMFGFHAENNYAD